MRTVGAELTVEVNAPSRLSWQIGVASPDDCVIDEEIRLTLDGRRMAFEELAAPSGGRLWVLDAPVGTVTLSYRASVKETRPQPATDLAEELLYLRPSRYCESDRFIGMADRLFLGMVDPVEQLAAVSSWVIQQLEYVGGSSRPTDGAVESMLAGRGVCRDFAHLTVSLLRALGIPARFTAVYAPGLAIMEFHAVAEAKIGESWVLVDNTLLAPRAAMVRIATGRDAADTSFLASDGGSIQLTFMQVHATVDGPAEDIRDVVCLS